MTSGLRRLFAGLTMTLTLYAGTSHADSHEVAALEARVAQLESMIEQLLEADKPAAAPAASKRATPSSSYKFGGYVKLDAMVSDYGDGDLAPGSAGTQFYIPATIPVGGESSDANLDMQAR